MSKRFLPVLLLLATAALAGCGDDEGRRLRQRHLQRHAHGVEHRAGLRPGAGRQLRLPRRDQFAAAKAGRAAAEHADRRGRGHGHGQDHDRRHDVHARRRQGALHRELVRLAGAAELLPDAHCHCHHTDDRGDRVLQCGDPTASGTGGPGYTSADEVDGSETYARGDPGDGEDRRRPTRTAHSSSSCTPTRRSTPDYTVFGHGRRRDRRTRSRTSPARATDDSNESGRWRAQARRSRSRAVTASADHDAARAGR